jgi:hypothetical protein
VSGDSLSRRGHKPDGSAGSFRYLARRCWCFLKRLSGATKRPSLIVANGQCLRRCRWPCWIHSPRQSVRLIEILQGGCPASQQTRHSPAMPSVERLAVRLPGPVPLENRNNPSLRTAAPSRLVADKVFHVTRVHARHGQQHQEIGGIEIRVPGRFAADPGTDAQVALDERRQLGGQILAQGG